MIIKGKRGNYGRGFSLKDNNNTGTTYYIWVWDKDTYDAKEVREKRLAKGNGNYSRVQGWKNLGRYPQAIPELYKHLIKVYGELDQEKVQKELEERKVLLDEQYKQKVLQKNREITDLLLSRNKPKLDYIDNLTRAKRILKQLEKEDA